MTEWTIDLVVPTTEGTGDETSDTLLVPPESAPWLDLVTGALIEDLQEDRADWFA